MRLDVDTLSKLGERDLLRRCNVASDTVSDSLRRAARDRTAPDCSDADTTLVVVGLSLDLVAAHDIERAASLERDSRGLWPATYHADGITLRYDAPLADILLATIGVADMLLRIDGMRKLTIDPRTLMRDPIAALVATLPENGAPYCRAPLPHDVARTLSRSRSIYTRAAYMRLAND